MSDHHASRYSSHDDERCVLSTGEIVRQATGNDLNAVIELGRLVWQHTYTPIAGEEYVAMGAAKWWTQDALVPAVRLGRAIVVTSADEQQHILGIATWGAQNGDAVLWRCYVHPQAQGRGIGRALVVAAVWQARQVGFTRMTLSHLLANTQAGLFYGALGFREIYRENEDSSLPASVWVALDLTDEEVQPW